MDINPKFLIFQILHRGDEYNFKKKKRILLPSMNNEKKIQNSY